MKRTMLFELRKKHFGNPKDTTARIGQRFVTNGRWVILRVFVANQEAVASKEALEAFLGPKHKVRELDEKAENYLAQSFEGADLEAKATGWVKLCPGIEAEAVQYETDKGEKLYLDRLYTEMLGITFDGKVSWSGKKDVPVVIDGQAVVAQLRF